MAFNTRKHTNGAVFYTVDGIEDAIIRKKKIAFNYSHLNEKAERDYVKTRTGERKRYYMEPALIKSVRVFRGYKVEIRFNISFGELKRYQERNDEAVGYGFVKG